MKAWIGAHHQALLLVLKKIRAVPLTNLIIVSVIGVTLSLPAGLYLTIQNLQAAAGNIETEPQLTLFLSSDTSEANIKEIERQLETHHGVREHHFLGREAAWRALKEKNGLNDALADLQKNPLPDAFVVRARERTPDAAEALQQEFATWPHIEHSQLDASWVKRLYALLQLGNKAVLVVSGLLGFALFAIIGNTIRLQILTQREEIEVSKLIGATDRFIRRPFLYAGTLHGLLGGVMAWLILMAARYAFNSSVSDLARLYASDFVLKALSLDASLALVGGSALLGWLGSWWAVSRYLSRLEQI